MLPWDTSDAGNKSVDVSTMFLFFDEGADPFRGLAKDDLFPEYFFDVGRTLLILLLDFLGFCVLGGKGGGRLTDVSSSESKRPSFRAPLLSSMSQLTTTKDRTLLNGERGISQCNRQWEI